MLYFVGKNSFVYRTLSSLENSVFSSDHSDFIMHEVKVAIHVSPRGKGRITSLQIRTFDAAAPANFRRKV
jgi:hypothetical protein